MLRHTNLCTLLSPYNLPETLERHPVISFSTLGKIGSETLKLSHKAAQLLNPSSDDSSLHLLLYSAKPRQFPPGIPHPRCWGSRRPLGPAEWLSLRRAARSPRRWAGRSPPTVSLRAPRARARKGQEPAPGPVPRVPACGKRREPALGSPGWKKLGDTNPGQRAERSEKGGSGARGHCPKLSLCCSRRCPRDALGVGVGER